jgi:MFS family permease
MGLLGTTTAVGTALGPSLGGLLTDQLGWRAIFLVQVPLGVLALLLVRVALPGDRRDAGRPVVSDVAGTLLLASTLTIYALATTRGRGDLGFVDVGLLAAAALGAVLFARLGAEGGGAAGAAVALGTAALAAAPASLGVVGHVALLDVVTAGYGGMTTGCATPANERRVDQAFPSPTCYGVGGAPPLPPPRNARRPPRADPVRDARSVAGRRRGGRRLLRRRGRRGRAGRGRSRLL